MLVPRGPSRPRPAMPAAPAVLLHLALGVMLLTPPLAAAEVPVAPPSPAAAAASPSAAERARIEDWFHCLNDGHPPIAQVQARLDAHPALAQAWSLTDPKQPWNTPCTALHLAVAAENKPLVQLLLDHHAAIDAQTPGCGPPLLWCSPAMGAWLIAHGAHPTIFWYAKIGDVAHVQALLAQDPSLVRARDATGRTALAIACQEHREVTVALLAAGADANAVDAYEQSVLVSAIGWDDAASRQPARQAMVDLLLAHGATWDAYAAVLHGNLAALTAAVDAHPALLTKHYGVAAGDGTLLIHAACVGNHQACVAFLLARGQSINALDDAGTTPLHEAAVHGTDLVAWLLAKGADASLREQHYGSDARGWAAYFHNAGALAAFDAAAKAAQAAAKAKADEKSRNSF